MFPWPQVTHGTLKTWRGETFWTVWRGSIFTISVTDARVTELIAAVVLQDESCRVTKKMYILPET